MIYEIEIKPQAIKDCKKIPKKTVIQIFDKIELLSNNLQGSVKHLTNFTPKYRLRVGNYRILFEVDGDKVVIYRIGLRKDIYKKR